MIQHFIVYIVLKVKVVKYLDQSLFYLLRELLVSLVLLEDLDLLALL